MRLAGDRDLLARVVDDLEEEAGVRAALVQLPGRVQVARSVAVRHDELAIPNEPFGFRRLIRAQAAGDYASLQERGRRVARIQIEGSQ